MTGVSLAGVSLAGVVFFAGVRFAGVAFAGTSASSSFSLTGIFLAGLDFVGSSASCRAFLLLVWTTMLGDEIQLCEIFTPGLISASDASYIKILLGESLQFLLN